MVLAIKPQYHPKAYLTHIQNVHDGLVARTRILVLLEQRASSAPALARTTKASYDVTRHHLLLLEAEAVVCRKGKRPIIWLLTGLGQKRLG